ncbi:MAG: hypothetical protein ABF292_13875, partial [Desulfobacterales bacterium]
GRNSKFWEPFFENRRKWCICPKGVGKEQETSTHSIRVDISTFSESTVLIIHKQNPLFKKVTL